MNGESPGPRSTVSNSRSQIAVSGTGGSARSEKGRLSSLLPRESSTVTHDRPPTGTPAVSTAIRDSAVNP